MSDTQKTDATASQQVESTGLGSYRRDLMKLLGAGAAVGAFGGVAAADEHEDDPEEEPVDEPVNDEPDEMQAPTDGTVHVVRTLITQSTNPERPADFFYQPTGLHVEPGDVVRFVFETPDHTVTSYHPAFGMQRRIPAGVDPFSSPIMGWDPRSLPDDLDMPPMENGEHVENDVDDNGESDVENDENGAEENGDNDVEENGDANDDANGEANGPVPTSWLYSFDTPGVYDLECAPHEVFGMAMRVVVGDETETTFETSDSSELPPPRAGPVGLSREILTDPNLEPEAIVEAGHVEWMDLEANEAPEDENGVPDDDDEPDEDENGEPDEDDNGEPDEDENGEPDEDDNGEPDEDENGEPDENGNGNDDDENGNGNDDE